MIEFGTNDTSLVGMDDAGCFGVELCRIGLPHLPISKATFNALKLSKHELPCRVDIDGKLHASPAFKVVSVASYFQGNKQIVRGKIRSVGVGINLASIIRNRPKELTFALLHDAVESEAIPGAKEIVKIHGWGLIIRQ